jgi:hypothetical protein
LIELDTGKIVQISRIPSIDAIVEGQMEGLDWIDSVDHLLEKTQMEAGPEHILVQR